MVEAPTVVIISRQSDNHLTGYRLVGEDIEGCAIDVLPVDERSIIARGSVIAIPDSIQ